MIDGILRDLEPVRTDLLVGGVFAEEALGHWIRAERKEAAAVAMRPQSARIHDALRSLTSSRGSQGGWTVLAMDTGSEGRSIASSLRDPDTE